MLQDELISIGSTLLQHFLLPFAPLSFYFITYKKKRLFTCPIEFSPSNGTSPAASAGLASVGSALPAGLVKMRPYLPAREDRQGRLLGQKDRQGRLLDRKDRRDRLPDQKGRRGRLLARKGRRDRLLGQEDLDGHFLFKNF